MLTEEPVIHEDSHQIISDSPMKKDGQTGRIHSATQGTNNLFLPYPILYLFKRMFHKGLHRPGGGTFGNPIEKISQDLFAPGRMNHFRVELYPKKPFFLISYSREGRIRGMGNSFESGRKLGYTVPMAHPDG